MLVDPGSLLLATGEMFAQFMRAAPRFETYRSESAQLTITGEPGPIMNPLVAVGSRLDDATRAYCQILRERDLPSVAFISPGLDGEFQSIADATGFQKGRPAPLMAYEAGEVAPIRHNFSISVAASAADREDVLAVWEPNTIPHNFYQPFGFACLDHPDVTAFITRENDIPIATTTTTTVGAIVGIWGVHTLPEHRRKGAAIATVAHVMNHHQQRGATAFLLYATQMGRPVYEKLGFQNPEQPSVWVRQPTAAQT
jgi:GNAT superfamily N-acetyltransferase